MITSFNPDLEADLAHSGRQRSDMELTSSIFVVPTDNPEQARRYEADTRQ